MIGTIVLDLLAIDIGPAFQHLTSTRRSKTSLNMQEDTQ